MLFPELIRYSYYRLLVYCDKCGDEIVFHPSSQNIRRKTIKFDPQIAILPITCKRTNMQINCNFPITVPNPPSAYKDYL